MRKLPKNIGETFTDLHKGDPIYKLKCGCETPKCSECGDEYSIVKYSDGGLILAIKKVGEDEYKRVKVLIAQEGKQAAIEKAKEILEDGNVETVTISYAELAE